MSMCDTCKQEPGEYICIQPECVKIKDNKMACYSCYLQQHNQNTHTHTPKKISHVCLLATEKCNKQIKILEQMISSTTQELSNLESFLENQKQIFILWHDQQKKSVKVCIETQNQKLQLKIKEAQEALKQQNLDSMLNYCIINVSQQEELYQKAYEQSNFVTEFQINEIQARVNFIKYFTFSPSDFSNIFVNMAQANIPKAQEKSRIQYQQCNNHQKPQKYLCIHKDCISYKSAFPFHCESCFTDVHKQHDFKTYAKKYKFIKKEQDDKTQLINNEQEKIKCYMQQELNKNCKLIQKQQQEKMYKYESIKSNMLTIKEQSINHLNKLINYKFIQNNINICLLSKTIEEIKQDYQIEYKRFSQKMSIDLKRDEREIINFSAIIDQKYEKEQNEISRLNLELQSKNDEINKLKRELTLVQQLNSQYKDFSQKLQILQNSQSNIKKQIDEFTKNIKEKIKGKIYMSNFDQQFLKSLDYDFKLIQAQINSTEQIIENVINEYNQISNNQKTQKSNISQLNQKCSYMPQNGANNQRQELISDTQVNRVRGKSIAIKEVQGLGYSYEIMTNLKTQMQTLETYKKQQYQPSQPIKTIQVPLKINNG